ncbi:MAG: hypothetical protein JST96_07935, partial [Bacteroidetes bacterium]|nr:hypothetical protein [Bacteroidota bacterium]
IFPDYIKVFDEQTSRRDSFNIQGESVEVTDFFLYDLDKDGEPEIFIFNVGKIAGENVVSLDVYSLGKGSVKVGFE